MIRFSSIGDLVLTTPVIRCLKNKYPDAHVTLLIKKQFFPVMAHNPYIDRFEIFDSDLKTTIHSLKKENFDFVIDLQKNFRSRKIRKSLGKAWFSFPKLNFKKWLYVRLKINLMPDKSIVARYFEAVKALKVGNDGRGLDFFIPEEAKTKLEDLPTGHLAGFVACVIGGSFFTKKFPVAKWQEFIKISTYPLVLLGGPEDREAGAEIAKVGHGKVYNACGKFSLLESADLVRRSRVVISNDTGLMHIAAAFQKPIISLWGNTASDMGMFPYYGQNNLKTQPSPLSVIMENKGLSCHPCSKLGYDQCPKGHFKCMNDLSVMKIQAAVHQFWKRG